MFTNFINMASAMFRVNSPSKTQPKKDVDNSNPFGDVNPFSNNPFTGNNTSLSFYGQNQPIKGGFFAGYHNDQANIVGKNLFIQA